MLFDMTPDDRIRVGRELIAELAIGAGTPDRAGVDRVLAGLAGAETELAHAKQCERRLGELTDSLYALAALDFAKRPVLRNDGTAIDGAAACILMLFEELNAYVAERARVEQALEDGIRARTAALVRANSELVSTREHLVRAEKLALVGRLAGGIAHEVNNPLAAVMANLASLAEDAAIVERLWLAAKAAAIDLAGHADPSLRAHARALFPPEERERMEQLCELRDMVGDSLRSARRIAELVKGFLRLATFDVPGVPGQTELASIVAECVAALPSELPRRVIHEPSPDPIVARVSADDLRTALTGILIHLLSRGRSEPETPPLTLSVATLDGRARIIVTDPELVLSAEECLRLFDPKVDVDTQQGRTLRLNLGLTASYHLLHRNGAEVAVRAGSTAGTEIEVVFGRVEAVDEPSSRI
jgi:C4-dicarboxylate-specific signal transduction histidine kinase